MSRMPNAARYGAIRHTEITSELAPPAVVEVVELLSKAVNARIKAQAEWVAAKDAYDAEVETIAERQARATVTGEKMPADQTEKLDAVMKTAAVKRDTTGKVCKEYEDALAAAIVSERKEWVDALAVAIEERKALIEASCADIESELSAIDRLQATRKLVTETRPGFLDRFRGGSWSSDARKGLGEIRRWVSPPAKPKSNVVGRNIIGYGPNVLQLGHGELGREESR